MDHSKISYIKQVWQMLLIRLKDAWDNIIPGFHYWFKRKRSSVSIECIILEARQDLGIEGRFYTNGLELKHKLQKKKLTESEIPKEVSVVTDVLQKWSEDFACEEMRA